MVKFKFDFPLYSDSKPFFNIIKVWDPFFSTTRLLDRFCVQLSCLKNQQWEHLHAHKNNDGTLTTVY